MKKGNGMSASGGLTNGEVQELVYTWFQYVTDKAELHKLLAMLSSDELDMHFPETVIRNHTEFAQWYDSVINLFFDEAHELKMLAIDLDGTEAKVTLVVNWQARTWKPPAAYSEWQEWNVHQTWTVKQDPRSGKPVICGYYVGEFDPVPVRR
jgi:hypothetical protein